MSKDIDGKLRETVCENPQLLLGKQCGICGTGALGYCNRKIEKVKAFMREIVPELYTSHKKNYKRGFNRCRDIILERLK